LTEAARRRSRPGEAMWGASALVSDGAVVRGLSASSRFVPSALIDFWRLARGAVTGGDPTLPRKTY